MHKWCMQVYCARCDDETGGDRIIFRTPTKFKIGITGPRRPWLGKSNTKETAKPVWQYMISVISSFSDSTTGENTTTGYVNRLFVTFCDMSQKAIDITGYGPRPCGVVVGFLLNTIKHTGHEL